MWRGGGGEIGPRSQESEGMLLRGGGGRKKEGGALIPQTRPRVCLRFLRLLFLSGHQQVAAFRVEHFLSYRGLWGEQIKGKEKQGYGEGDAVHKEGRGGNERKSMAGLEYVCTSKGLVPTGESLVIDLRGEPRSASGRRHPSPPAKLTMVTNCKGQTRVSERSRPRKRGDKDAPSACTSS